ncbi:MAG: hypothetical protein JXA42_09835 [Anaerolineales bacterium]|nr:hypothetical protein [Anaerolineales bacterium]
MDDVSTIKKNRLEPEREPCSQDDHLWLAHFYESGKLAYWQCQQCGLTDRVAGQLPERLDGFSGWIEDPPRLEARGARPPSSTRRWTTPAGTILCEGDPSNINFIGLPIPGLEEAHSYVELGERNAVVRSYEPERQHPRPAYDHYWLVRYQVIGDELVRYKSHCYEDRTYETPFAQEADKSVVLSGLTPDMP